MPDKSAVIHFIPAHSPTLCGPYTAVEKVRKFPNEQRREEVSVAVVVSLRTVLVRERDLWKFRERKNYGKTCNFSLKKRSMEYFLPANKRQRGKALSDFQPALTDHVTDIPSHWFKGVSLNSLLELPAFSSHRTQWRTTSIDRLDGGRTTEQSMTTSKGHRSVQK